MCSRVEDEEGAVRRGSYAAVPKFPSSLQHHWEGAQPVHVIGGQVPWRAAWRRMDVCDERPWLGVGRRTLKAGQGVGECRGPAWLLTCLGVMEHMGQHRQGRWWAGR